MFIYHYVSYRGATGRISLWLTMCGEFHMLPAFIFVFGICPWIVVGLSFVRDPCADSSVPLFLLVKGCPSDARDPGFVDCQPREVGTFQFQF